jgi:hypothetical protein
MVPDITTSVCSYGTSVERVNCCWPSTAYSSLVSSPATSSVLPLWELGTSAPNVPETEQRVAQIMVESKGFWRLCITLSIIEFEDFVHRLGFKITKKQNVSETGSVSVFRWGEGDNLLGSLEIVNPNHWTTARTPKRVYLYVFLPSPENRNRSSFRNFVFSSYLEFRTIDKVHKPSDSEHTRTMSTSEPPCDLRDIHEIHFRLHKKCQIYVHKTLNNRTKTEGNVATLLFMYVYVRVHPLLLVSSSTSNCG